MRQWPAAGKPGPLRPVAKTHAEGRGAVASPRRAAVQEPNRQNRRMPAKGRRMEPGGRADKLRPLARLYSAGRVTIAPYSRNRPGNGLVGQTIGFCRLSTPVRFLGLTDHKKRWSVPLPSTG